jgi:hypothetical protein
MGWGLMFVGGYLCTEFKKAQQCAYQIHQFSKMRLPRHFIQSKLKDTKYNRSSSLSVIHWIHQKKGHLTLKQCSWNNPPQLILTLPYSQVRFPSSFVPHSLSMPGLCIEFNTQITKSTFQQIRSPFDSQSTFSLHDSDSKFESPQFKPCFLH